jgi:CubicO group peptidase (beta-lactamase class C family)
MSRPVLLALLVCASLSAFAGGRRPPPSVDEERLTRLSREIDQLRRELRVPGLALAVVKDGRKVWKTALGDADLSPRRRATPHTLFHTASLTKPLSGALILQMVDEGRLDLNAPLSRYVDEPAARGRQVRHILTHTSGGTPGERFQYDNTRFKWLAKVAETVDGDVYQRIFERRVLDAVGMKESVPGIASVEWLAASATVRDPDRLTRYTRALREGLTRTYRLDRTLRPRPNADVPRTFSTAGGLVTSISDLAKFDAALDGGSFLPARAHQTLFAPPLDSDGAPLPYAHGWFVEEYRGYRLFWHYGHIPDVCSSLYVKVPERGLSLILLANSDGFSAPFSETLIAGRAEGSPAVLAFLRLFALEAHADSPLPSPDWGRSPRSFAQWAAKRVRAGVDYDYADETSARAAMTRWMEKRRGKTP